ncbi:MAG: flagellar basal body P-ring formation protein FlgA [Pedosphaera sp.]|nr:flagellar basal body P-ring formation protein FlgA [Pedosphaera sp.]MSS99809.1 flagellar basal body P-ring formation protein FlgA [Pedosphaera sp.]
MKSFALILRLLVVALLGPATADLSAQTAPAKLAAKPADSAAPTRMVESDELLELLTAKLVPTRKNDESDLLLEFAREWKPVSATEGELSVKLLEQPTSGPNAYFLVRFELLADKKKVGTWTVFLKGKMMRTVWVTRSAAQRGEDLGKLDLAQERRDVMNLQGGFWTGPGTGPAQSLTQNLSAGAILFARHTQLMPVIRRGELVDAIISDKALLVRLKVEVLEDGAPGQLVRIRNNTTRKELRGKVINESTIQVVL